MHITDDVPKSKFDFEVLSIFRSLRTMRPFYGTDELDKYFALIESETESLFENQKSTCVQCTRNKGCVCVSDIIKRICATTEKKKKKKKTPNFLK